MEIIIIMEKKSKCTYRKHDSYSLNFSQSFIKEISITVTITMVMLIFVPGNGMEPNR